MYFFMNNNWNLLKVKLEERIQVQWGPEIFSAQPTTLKSDQILEFI